MQPHHIAIIGGGLGGCLAALMLAKQRHSDGSPKFDLTIIEMRDSLLAGASQIGFRLHLGGEYPLDPVTMRNCVDAAVVHRLLLPDTIYSRTPRMQFLIARGTEEHGTRCPSDKKALTLAKFELNYERHVRQRYERIFRRVVRHQGTAAGSLLGTYKKGQFFYRLAEAQFIDYRSHVTGLTPEYDIAGGFQTSEPGVDLPRFHELLRCAVSRQVNVTQLVNRRAVAIEGCFPNYIIRIEGVPEPLRANQILLSAWQNNPGFAPLQDFVTVYRRAIMRVTLPDGPRPPVFVLSPTGEYGGMFAPESHRTALAYLPVKNAGHIKHHRLTAADSSLPDDWAEFPDGMEHAQYCARYVDQLMRRFPTALRGAESPQMIVHDTLSFNESIDQRQNESVVECERGKYVLYSTKATYAASIALQTAHLVHLRYRAPGNRINRAPADTLRLILSLGNRDLYSLADILDSEANGVPSTLGLHDHSRLSPITEEMLRNPNRFREPLDTCPIPINYVSADWRFLFVNRAYAAWYGRSPAELIGTAVEDLVGRDGFAVIRAYCDRALEGEAIFYTIDVSLRIGRRRIRCSYCPVREDSGHVTGWCGVIEDMTTETE